MSVLYISVEYMWYFTKHYLYIIIITNGPSNFIEYYRILFLIGKFSVVKIKLKIAN